MRVLLDTNVLVSAWLSSGACTHLVRHCRRHHEVVSCDFILDEFRRTLTHDFEIPNVLALDAVSMFRECALLVEPAQCASSALRDPADAPVLGAALAGRCDCIVTGDKDLLSMGDYRGIRILSPRQFWQLEGESGSE